MEIKDINEYLKSISEDESVRKKIDYIRTLVVQHKNDWDITIPEYQNIDQPSEILTLLLYEYSEGLSKLTEEQVSSSDILKKLSNLMGKIRFGEWKENDGYIEYDGMSVLDGEYRKNIGRNFGAQTIDYIGDDRLQKAIIAYDNKIGEGINLNSLDDLRHTFFHEWTHVMEMDKLKESDYKEVTISKRQYRNNERMANGEVWGTGLSTKEYGENAEKYNQNNRIMHNQIDEGMVELIARKLVATTIGQEQADKTIDKSRYLPNVKVAQAIMDVLGEKDVITLFITNSQELTTQLESIQIEGRDVLHYMSDFVNDQRCEQVIPEYSHRTKFFKENGKNLIKLFGIPREKIALLREEFAINEIEGTSLANFEKIFSRYGTRELSESEIGDFLKIVEEYKGLLRYENEFYEKLSKGLEKGINKEVKNENENLSVPQCLTSLIDYSQMVVTSRDIQNMANTITSRQDIQKTEKDAEDKHPEDR